ncbi:MAG TPA: methionine--tRNA ligase [Synergistales bacterium]|jgi:methionyl-tRNA synthetase|nr:methionine--tRNA ligase [Synergistales bacterium]MDD3830236.1 methionine--tRNA ligase [Synergistales bacterium]MDD5514571.1 methionine--tRNA ligase [Synergistales bacterium]HOI82115.1 methionine--tRNA ligase [Synergistales bacterium]HPJ48041.1 methionine--tRNA ligase [Synergistales bacterium]
MPAKFFYITTPIYYVNDVPHIGHAYTTIAADVMARYKRMRGFDVMFATGTDEHGQKIQQAAEKRDMTAQQLVDSVMVNFKNLWKELEITNTDFIRTTEARHERVVQYIFSRLMEQGDIYKGSYKGWYCVPCETYFPESQIGGEKLCPDCGRPLQNMTEESYFFRMSKYERPLLDYYEKNPGAILPQSRYNEVLSFIRSGLRDQSISRTSVSWGVPLPGDERHVIYVWFDALINYLTVCGYPHNGELVEKYWPTVNHIMAKDIIRFHCIVWPAMLLALGLNPPATVFSHGWWTVEGEKMSKSRGNVVDPFEMAALYGVDAFRYFLMREIPFGSDGDFSERALVGRINSDLANDQGNLLNRTLQMIDNFTGGVVPFNSGTVEDLDREIRTMALATLDSYRARMDSYAFDEALKEIWTLIRRANKYIDETMPWKLGKEGNLERLGPVLNTLCETLRFTAAMVSPFMPGTARKIFDQLGLSGDPTELLLDELEWGKIPEGCRVSKKAVLFPRIDLKEWEKKKAERDARKGATPDPGDHEDEVSIDDFKKIELRVARVVKVEAVPKADKLYRMDLDLGYERRTIVSGIREFRAPEDLEGRQIIVICNLKPASLRGVVSNGMLLAAETSDGKSLALLTVDQEIAPGSRVH